jgi:hypothetical protein
MNNERLRKILQETFGEPIGSYAGEIIVGVRDEKVCPACGMMLVDGQCECNQAETCSSCGMLPVEAECNCGSSSLGESCNCGMNQVEVGCGCTHNESEELEEVETD